MSDIKRTIDAPPADGSGEAIGPVMRSELNEFERRCSSDLFAIVSEHAADAG